MSIFRRCAGALAALLFSCAALAQIGYLGPIVGSGGGFITGGGTFTGQLLGPNGTACTTPTYSFSGASTTGFTRNGNTIVTCVNGNIVATFDQNSNSIALPSATSIAWNVDTSLFRDGAADTLAQRRGTNAQAFRVYNTFTDASNYERAVFDWTTSANTLTIGMVNAGTGATRNIQIVRGGAQQISFDGSITVSAVIRAATDSSAIDLGDTTHRFKDVLAARFRSTQTTAPTCTSNCGTSPAVAGGDTGGIVTMGASGVPASGWVLTFNGTWAAAPSCVVQSALTTMVVGKMPIAVQTSTTTMTVTTNGTAPATSDKYAYVCIGVQ